MPVTAARRTLVPVRASVVLTTALLALVLAPGAAVVSPAEPPSDEECLDSISAPEMLQTVQDLQDFGSRAFCLDSAKEAASYIHGRFLSLGLDVQYQNFTFAGYSASNVVAVMNGTNPDAGTVLFGAHYDSENSKATNLSLVQELPAPGADDDASGVAAVIELAEALRDTRMNQTMKFVAFGAEETGFDATGGLVGSWHFVEQEIAAGATYECAVVMDMIGFASGSGNHGVIVTNAAEVPFATAASEAIQERGLDLMLETMVNPSIRYSDHAPFWLRGYPAVLAIEALSDTLHPINPYYHSAYDTVDKLSGPQMENITRCLLAGALAILEPSPEDRSGWTLVLIVATILAATASVTFIWHSRKRRKCDLQ